MFELIESFYDRYRRHSALGVFCDGFESGDTSGWGSGGSPCTQTTRVEPVYSSEGRLYGLARSTAPSQRTVFYFGDRPVGQLDVTADVESWLWLTTDHLGTPILASDELGSVAWSGGFEPFGPDFSGAEGSGVFLRFPGQWVDGSWGASPDGSPIYENLNRWYAFAQGRYQRPDPVGDVVTEQAIRDPLTSDRERFSYYSYVDGNPISFMDPLGLLRTKGCKQGDEKAIRDSFEEYCGRLDDQEISDCMNCIGSGIAKGLKRLCDGNNRTVRCNYEATGRCAKSMDEDGNALVTCGWAVPLGRTIRLCSSGLDTTYMPCGPIGCTLMHEMTHQLGYPRESKPRAVEKCLGCN